MGDFYTTVSIYYPVSQTTLGYSDHVMVNFILAYREKLKQCKTEEKKVN